MTDNRQLNSEASATEAICSPDAAVSKTAPTVVADSNRRERRRLIRAAVASVPVVLTFTAGKARAQDGTVADSGASEAPAPDAPIVPPNENNVGPDGPGELSPAEKLETFGLQRADRPEGYSEDPFRDLDTVSEPVDLSSP